MFQLTETPISRDDLILKLQNDKAGALVVFEGWVRDHNEGKKVSSLEYQVYEELARKEGQKILDEAKHKFNLHHIVSVHRYGHLKIGETAVWVGAIASHRDDAFKASRYVIDEIKLRLPVWKKEHYLNENPKWVFCRDHHTHVHFHEHDYYQKQEKVADQEKLKKARVLVVGAGGLGCPVLLSLTTAGVGHIDVVDFDKISISNIHRQPLYSPEVVGEKKVTIARNKLSSLNPFIHVHGHDALIDSENVERFITDKDLIIDCTDNLETKFLLHDACFKHRIPLISASIYKFEGQIRTFVPGNTGCLRCTHDIPPDDSQLGNCNDFGVLGSAVSTIGSLEANEALLFLMEGKNNTTESTFFFNVKSFTQMKIKNTRKMGCACCEGIIEFQENQLEVSQEASKKMDAIIIDVRDKDDSVLNEYIQAQKPVIVFCHRGIRSKRLVRDMRAKGHRHFFSLKGGACLL